MRKSKQLFENFSFCSYFMGFQQIELLAINLENYFIAGLVET